METTNGLLDQVKERHGLPSDYKLGMVLGLSKNAVGQYRKGVSRPDDAVAIRIANLLDLEPAYVVACMHAERAKQPELKSLWITMASRFQRSGAVACFAVFALAALTQQTAESSMPIDVSTAAAFVSPVYTRYTSEQTTAFLAVLVLSYGVAHFIRAFCLISDTDGTG